MLAAEGAYCPHIHQCSGAARQFAWRLGQRRLPHYLLVTSLNGSEQITVERETFDVRPGHSYLIQPNTLHVLGSKQGNQPVWLHFDLIYNSVGRESYEHPADEANLGTRAVRLQPSPKEIFAVELPILVPDALISAFRREVPRIVARWHETTQLAVMAANLDLAKLLFALVELRWRNLGLRKPVDLEARLRQAEHIALANLGSSFGAREFAAAAGLSRAHFSEVFRRRRGVSPAAFLRHERLSRAQQLLATTDDAIADVGAAVGYPEPSAFGRAFLAQTGRTPTQYREQSARADVNP